MAISVGCGDEGDGSEKRSGSAFARSIQNAQEVTVSDFPAVSGRSLQELGGQLQSVQMGLATSVFTEGESRLAFGMVGTDNSFIYGKTAVYIAPTPSAPARGPFLAPADPLVIEPPFRSRNAATESDAIAAIYGARLRLRPGRYAVLAMTKPPTGPPVGGGVTIEVARSSPIPEVGERPPPVDTETVASAGGDIESIETRVPEDDMHEENFADVVGKKPVVLLFATPALCQTRVCGPVTDIAAQLQKEYGDRATFIHQEVYRQNEVPKGLREPLRRFGLQTEPWLFTFDSEGRVAARIEGSFGTQAFRNAVEAAL